MKRRLIFILAIICLLLFSGCNTLENQTPEPKITIPTPAEGKSIVYGIALNSITSKPIAGTLFLAKNLTYDLEGIPPTVSFSTQTDPSAVYNRDTGEFYFKDIEPGLNYVIVIHNGPNDFTIVRDPEADIPLSLAIEENQVLDVGNLLIDEP